MAIDLKKRSGTAVGNFNFEAKIYSADQELILSLPVDAVRGLGDARTNIIRHRVMGDSDTTLRPFAGLSTPDTATLEGSFLFDGEDLKKLQLWRDQVKGRQVGNADIAGYYRDITVVPVSDTVTNEGTTQETGETMKLVNCVAVRLSISDFDINAPAISNWSLEVEYEDMKIGE